MEYSSKTKSYSTLKIVVLEENEIDKGIDDIWGIWLRIHVPRRKVLGIGSF